MIYPSHRARTFLRVDRREAVGGLREKGLGRTSEKRLREKRIGEKGIEKKRIGENRSHPQIRANPGRIHHVSPEISLKNRFFWGRKDGSSPFAGVGSSGSTKWRDGEI